MHYPAKFTDEYGSEETTIVNDGEDLRMDLREVTFEGCMFDEFSPIEGTDPSLLSKFKLDGRNYLRSFRIEFDIPIPVVVQDKELTSRLSCTFDLGPHVENVEIVLSHEGSEFRGTGDFESALEEIQKNLPEDTFIKACINCQFSDYSVFGNGFFGCIACCRNIKSEYLNVKTKQDYMDIESLAERSAQEISLCNEFQRRTRGTGYRG